MPERVCQRVFGRCLSVAVAIGAVMVAGMLGGCRKGSLAPVFFSPSYEIVATDAGSVLCVHRAGEVEYILYHASLINVGIGSSCQEIEALSDWLDVGHIDLISSGGDTIGIFRNGERPDVLHLNGQQFSVGQGNVFVIEDSQTFHQMAIEVDPVRDAAGLQAFGVAVEEDRGD